MEATNCELDSEVTESKREGRKRRLFRLLVRCAFLSAMTAALLGLAPWPWAPMVVPALSPYIMVAAGLAGPTTETAALAGAGAPTWMPFSVAALVGLPVLMLVLFRRRWFCRYACPVGLLSEPFRRLHSLSRRERVGVRGLKLPHLGRWIVLATLSGACLGYPLAIWLDPLAIFSGSFGLVRNAAGMAGWVALSALLLILLSNVLWPHAWCLRVCPLGATQELLALPQRLLQGRPGGTLAAAREASPDRLPRRSVLSFGAGLLAAGAGVRVAVGPWSRAHRAERDAIRPPGAAGAGQFPWLCVRCGNCVRSCPEGIIHPDERPAEPAGLLAPMIRFDKTYCRETCRRCTEVCPSGAIRRLSLDEKRRTPIGLAEVDMSLCLLAPENGERECGVCGPACPYAAIRFEFDYDTYISTPTVDAAKCTGCGACEIACPGTNDAQRSQSARPIRLRRAVYVVA